ncbi:hypothetical protein S7711_00500 [Stachybotrys chartarum IBT 7711]|uniref:Uncharacterized protein n=1 Tax=Stachybotrys chartarum (strain CBS 109288 / IBT 7711) TaxID=1280523 RepID=A0A084B9W4_STACB|nr:hypothetical protein S7711_00500 [Stachybotrys chartarum IBT 7711]
MLMFLLDSSPPSSSDFPFHRGLTAWRKTSHGGPGPNRDYQHGGSKKSKGPIITKYAPPPLPPAPQGSSMSFYPPPGSYAAHGHAYPPAPPPPPPPPPPAHYPSYPPPLVPHRASYSPPGYHSHAQPPPPSAYLPQHPGPPLPISYPERPPLGHSGSGPSPPPGYSAFPPPPPPRVDAYSPPQAYRPPVAHPPPYRPPRPSYSSEPPASYSPSSVATPAATSSLPPPPSGARLSHPLPPKPSLPPKPPKPLREYQEIQRDHRQKRKNDRHGRHRDSWNRDNNPSQRPGHKKANHGERRPNSAAVSSSPAKHSPESRREQHTPRRPRQTSSEYASSSPREVHPMGAVGSVTELPKKMDGHAEEAVEEPALDVNDTQGAAAFKPKSSELPNLVDQALASREDLQEHGSLTPRQSDTTHSPSDTAKSDAKHAIGEAALEAKQEAAVDILIVPAASVPETDGPPGSPAPALSSQAHEDEVHSKKGDSPGNTTKIETATEADSQLQAGSTEVNNNSEESPRDKQEPGDDLHSDGPHPSPKLSQIRIRKRSVERRRSQSPSRSRRSSVSSQSSDLSSLEAELLGRPSKRKRSHKMNRRPRHEYGSRPARRRLNADAQSAYR